MTTVMVVVVIVVVVIIIIISSSSSPSYYVIHIEVYQCIPGLWRYPLCGLMKCCDQWYTVRHFLTNVQCSSDILCFENPAFIHFSWSHNSCWPNLPCFVFKFWYFVFPDIDITLCIMICFIPRHCKMGSIASINAFIELCFVIFLIPSPCNTKFMQSSNLLNM